MRPTETDRALGIAALLSGAAALIHETLWTRSFSLCLGTTVEAAAATFSAFVVGLALGARLGSKLRSRGAWRRVELSIAVVAGTIDLLLFALRDVLPMWLPSGGTRPIASFFLAALFVLPPTLLMGATFPIMLALAVDRRRVATVYAANVVGGALGAALCGFITLPAFGTHATMAIAAMLNVSAALAIKRGPQGSDAGVSEPDVDTAAPADRVLSFVALASGALVLGLEIVWARLASYIVGTRVYATTTLLAWVLVLLAIAAAAAGRLVQRDVTRRLRTALFAAPFAIAISALLARAWIARLPALDDQLTHLGGEGLLLRTLALGAMIAPALLALGLLFPLALAASRVPSHSAARFYVWNAAGAVLGSLLVGFVLLPSIGVYATAFVVAIGAALVGASTTRGVGLARPLCIVVLLLVLAPPPLVVVSAGQTVLFRREDRYSVFEVLRDRAGHLRALAGNTELVFHLGVPITSYVQQMQGHLGVLANPRARTALVLGSGYGITAGTLAQYPSIEWVDAVEILPAMVEAASLFEPFNFGYQRDPKVHVVIDDGRQFLARNREQYDIVSINVSDPHLPASSSLFTRDFYRIVKAHLRPGGVAIVHAFGSDRDTILATMRAELHIVGLHRAYMDGGFNVVAAATPLQLDDDAIRAVTAAPQVQAAFESIGFTRPVDAVQIAHDQAADPQLPAAIATDDRPLIEFSTKGKPALLFNSNE